MKSMGLKDVFELLVMKESRRFFSVVIHVRFYVSLLRALIGFDNQCCTEVAEKSI